MKTRALLVAVSTLVAACGGSSPLAPTPSPPTSFLAGRWTGTLTVQRGTRAPVTTPTEWVILQDHQTLLRSFTIIGTLHDPMFPSTVTLLAELLDSDQPGSRLQADAVFQSPCAGNIEGIGPALRTTVSLDVSGMGCVTGGTYPSDSFRGTITLSR